MERVEAWGVVGRGTTSAEGTWVGSGIVDAIAGGGVPPSGTQPIMANETAAVIRLMKMLVLVLHGLRHRDTTAPVALHHRARPPSRAT
jgi:hypothetical protein